MYPASFAMIPSTAIRVPAVRRSLYQCLQPDGHAVLRQSSTKPCLVSFSRQTRLFSTPRSTAYSFSGRARERAAQAVLSPEEQYARSKRSMKISAIGIAVCALAMYGVIYFDVFDMEPVMANGTKKEGKGSAGGIKLDGPAADSNLADTGKLVIDGVEQVPTGQNTIKHFPKSIRLPKSLGNGPAGRNSGDEVIGETEEYRLLGLGIRAVTFLNIHVYVVGMYIALSDLPKLQQQLVKLGATPVSASATNESAVTALSLVPGERESLKDTLLDPEVGEQAWDQILKQGDVKTAFRIVPTRNTDYPHMRDGWVRAITRGVQRAAARSKALAAAQSAHNAQPVSPIESEFADDSFGASFNNFKGIIGTGRKAVPKGQPLIFVRGPCGALDLVVQPDGGHGLGRSPSPSVWLGGVGDERIGRLLWANYLAGKQVASEGARRSIIDGLMEIAGRPVGTVFQP